MTANADLFVREGEFWTVQYQGETYRFKDSKGLRYLHVLVARRGQEVHVLDLVAAADGRPGPARDAQTIEPGLSHAGFGDAGDVIDPQARAAYRRRLLELTEEADEAERFHDPVRAERARTEIDALEQQLAAAFGLGGRARKAASSAERARVNVRNSIASAIKAMTRPAPTVAAHFTRAVRTGAYCWYAADDHEWVTEIRRDANETPRQTAAAEERGRGVVATSERMLATFLFTDIVESTRAAAALGDARWRSVLDTHNQVVRNCCRTHGGTEVERAGDGFFMLFDAPANAIAAALEIRSGVDSVGVQVRTGIHTGE